jgi:predicted amidohydrolase YtcJ
VAPAACTATVALPIRTGADAKVLDYGENFIYPGFLESHCHGHLAGLRFIG